MASFTWSEMAAKMRDDLAKGNWRTKSYDIDGMKKEFFSPDEFLKMLAYVENRAANENVGLSLRTSLRGANR